ncbi:hypothetical protein GOP47_0001905 [Adiantum capillus-veneris]|uniref:Myb-like domain-containing protein n=1 Tax=Adiantum capillus-veneris TaxID=13818 RepID=A0A9D4ZQK9_ADICA|nr:hypothetical protein GOP47_0001905 [Adiantum capillus-veneris]
MADAKDILGLPKSAFAAEKPKKPPKDVPKKPDGVSREVYALTGGLPPIMPALDTSFLKKRPVASSKKITWQWLPFSSSARKDNLQLYHWVKLVDGVPPTGDYFFARYNKSIDVVRYTEEEYKKVPVDPKWTKQETDQLFELCEQFDLRFIVIADRFHPPRTVEDLKSRYYSAAKAVVLARVATPEEATDHVVVKESYNAAHETERRRALNVALSRPQEREDAETESKRNSESRLVVLTESRRISDTRLARKLSINDIDASGDGDAGERAPSTPARPGSPSLQHPSRPLATPAAPTLTSAFVTALNGTRLPRVFTRGALLTQLIQTVLPPGGARLSKKVEQTLEELGVQTKPKVPTQAVCAEHLELRKEILTMLNLKKQLQWRGAEVSVLRDNPYADIPPTPSTPKKSIRAGDQDRLWTGVGSDPDSFPGERTGKREHKRKAPARFSEGPPSPPSNKRSRKLKASEG